MLKPLIGSIAYALLAVADFEIALSRQCDLWGRRSWADAAIDRAEARLTQARRVAEWLQRLGEAERRRRAV